MATAAAQAPTKEDETTKQHAELLAKVKTAIELRPDARYLIILKDSVMQTADVTALIGYLNGMGVRSAVILVKDPERDIKVLEVEPTI